MVWEHFSIYKILWTYVCCACVDMDNTKNYELQSCRLLSQLTAVNDIWGSHSGDYEHYYLPGCETMQSGRGTHSLHIQGKSFLP